MAEVILDGTRTIVTGVRWDWSQLLAARGPKAFVVSGRSLREYSFPLNEEIRSRGGLVIEDANDLEAAIRKIILPTEASHATTLLQPVPDRVVGRIEVARRKGDISGWGVDEYVDKFLFDDFYFQRPDSVKSIIDQVARAFDGLLISYNHHTSHISYFRLLLPLIVPLCNNAKWIIIATDRVGDANAFTSVKRDYLDRSNLLNTLSIIARMDEPTIESILAAHGKEHRRFNAIPTTEMTMGEFEQALSAYKEIVLPRVAQYVPLVPSPDSAPLEFGIFDQRLSLLDTDLPQKISSSVLDTIIEELLQQLDDVSKHFNLHNLAPACSSKLTRVRERLVSIREEGLTEARVIALGISTHATRDHLAFEKENIELDAEGSISSAIGQVDVFLNRFRPWRSYLQDSELEAPGGISDRAIGAASIVLTAIAEHGDLTDEGAQFALRRSAYEASSAATAEIEKRGVLRITHNISAIIFGYVRDALRFSQNWRSDGLYNAIWNLVQTIEPQLNTLSALLPSMFSWIGRLMDWIRVVGMG